MQSETRRIILQVALFAITFVTTTLAGAEVCFENSIYCYDSLGVHWNKAFGWEDFVQAMSFSIPLMLILTVHEFGHYFTAMYYKVKTSLPYYIPIPPLPFFPSLIGTMGAVIRLRERPATTVQNFDIGLAGPVAGFVVALAITFYGFYTLPEPEYVFKFHPSYEKFGLNYADHVYDTAYLNGLRREAARKQRADSVRRAELGIKTPEVVHSCDSVVQESEADGSTGAVLDLMIGSNLIFWFFENTIADPERVPNEHEMMHYPVLLAAYIALFFTCLNLLPIGQLDGGHVVYGLFGYKVHKVIATVSFVGLVFYAGLGLDFLKGNEPAPISFGGPAIEVPSYLIALPAYLFFLYLCFKGLRQPSRDTFMYALLMLAVHFGLAQFAPQLNGYSAFMLFALLLGRLVGVGYPPAAVELPLDTRRIILGWIALLIFILCFTPAPIEIAVI